MNRKTRTILFIFFVLLFFITAPLAIMYAAGYQISLSWPLKFDTALQKTGALIIDSKPEGAKIFINEKPKQKFLNKYLLFNDEGIIRTPAKIKNLTPGEYNVKLEADGYWPWQKKLTIVPGQSTFAENIVLFRNELPVIFQNGQINNALISPDKNNYFIAGEEIFIKNIDNDQQIINFKIDNIATSTGDNAISWSQNNQKIIYKNNIFSINGAPVIDLGKKINTEISNLKWSDEADDLVYMQTADSLISFNLLENKEKKVIKNEKIIDYTIKSGNIIYLSQISNNQKLKVISAKDGREVSEIDLPFSDSYRIINKENEFINLFNKNQEILYLIDPLLSINPIRQIINNIKISYWIDSKKFIYANDFEIWHLDLSSNQKTLITRISQPITGLIWHPSNNYIIYSTQKNINIIELDDREKRSSTQIVTLDEINNLGINSNGGIIFFNAKIGNQTGLFKMHIQ
jgi:hypothetical protein